MVAIVAVLLAALVTTIASTRSRRAVATSHAVRVAAARRPHREIR